VGDPEAVSRHVEVLSVHSTKAVYAMTRCDSLKRAAATRPNGCQAHV
jgi:hypothetical protein